MYSSKIYSIEHKGSLSGVDFKPVDDILTYMELQTF